MSSNQKFNLSPTQECSWMNRQVLNYLDGALDPVQNSRAERHLKSCESCQVEVLLFKKAESSLKSAKLAIPESGDLRHGFYLKLAESQRRKSSPFNWRLATLPAISMVVLAVFAYQSGMLTKQKAAFSNNPSTVARIVKRPSSSFPIPNSLSLHPESTSLNTSIFTSRIGKQFNYKVNTQMRVAKSRPHRHSHLFQLAKNEGGYASHRLSKFKTDATRVKPPITFNNSKVIVASNYSRNLSENISTISDRLEGRETLSRRNISPGISLATFTTKTDLHVSDEERDFMSSTHVVSTRSKKSQPETVGIEANEEISDVQPAELPALP